LRNVHAIITETGNVAPSVGIHIGQEPRILILARPGSRRWAGSECIEICGRQVKRTIGVCKSDVDSGTTKPDDVSPSVGIHIGNFALGSR
jgi:hypothetical protein